MCSWRKSSDLIRCWLLQQYDSTSVSLNTSHLENVLSEFVSKLKGKMDLIYVLLPFLAFALSVQSVQSTSTSSCLDRCQFDTNCETTNYVQNSPCSYSCVCDGQSTYYEEKNFKRCGTDKRCYQGDCIDEVYDNCQYIYGSNFIGLLNPRNPCSYYCFDSRDPCKVYEEYFPQEYRCYTYSNTLGQCYDGRCITGEIFLSKFLFFEPK
ncbi:egg case protein variant 1 [Trichonephila inaurata madagascariensis]|uniref:Egg case protein variant 1 n=1 Tax=Trichonephila inaurata madagascariensis TaxID=2747483 RepID=A0A8X6ML63_9ARAC|nr:egg case protein variant 1 [Trichonephila inaurata madagascariensis]